MDGAEGIVDGIFWLMLRNSCNLRGGESGGWRLPASPESNMGFHWLFLSEGWMRPRGIALESRQSSRCKFVVQEEKAEDGVGLGKGKDGAGFCGLPHLRIEMWGTLICW